MVHNSTKFTESQIRGMTLLLTLHNKWRQRNVAVYEHPTDHDKVLTVGVPFDGVSDTVICEESKVYWQSNLELAISGKKVQISH